MENHFITEQTSSSEDFSKSLEYLIPRATVSTREKSGKFRSSGDGFLSEGFYLGQNLTENLEEIEILNSNSCILSIPSEGIYFTRLSNKPFRTCTPETGSIFLPTDSIIYGSKVNTVNDLIISLNYDQLKPILEKRYEISRIGIEGFGIEKKNKKVEVIYNLIINNLQALRYYPHFRESIHYKSSIKEVAKVLLADLIADSLQAKFKLRNSPDSSIVQQAEELIEAKPEKYFSIQQIADRVCTSPRNLQLVFHKHRGYTPMQFLKERKLNKARALLLNADCDTTIKKTAYDCGFLNLSSFSKSYKMLFGELPSETLKSIKGPNPS